MITVLLSILTGAVLGAAFGLMKLPLPAPITFAGVMGVLGVWLGFAIVMRFMPDVSVD
jgi:XapX domain-containing protein